MHMSCNCVTVTVTVCFRALQRRWAEDAKRDSEAFDARRQSEENVMLRKMYRGLLSKMQEWNADEQSELR